MEPRCSWSEGQQQHNHQHSDEDQNHSSLPIRRLQPSDNAKGFLALLDQISPTATPASDSAFQARFSDLASLGDDHLVAVVEDVRTGRIVATGSVFVERKFLRGCAKVGHIEDVVVDGGARGRGLGHRVVRYLADHAKEMGCYKVILDCAADRRGFYEKCGFQEKNLQMAIYF